MSSDDGTRSVSWAAPSSGAPVAPSAASPSLPCEALASSVLLSTENRSEPAPASPCSASDCSTSACSESERSPSGPWGTVWWASDATWCGSGLSKLSLLECAPSIGWSCSSAVGSSAVALAPRGSARSVSTATLPADAAGASSAPSAPVARSRGAGRGSEADESDTVPVEADSAAALAAAIRLDFRLKKHTPVTLWSRTCSSVSKRRPHVDQSRSDLLSPPPGSAPACSPHGARPRLHAMLARSACRSRALQGTPGFLRRRRFSFHVKPKPLLVSRETCVRSLRAPSRTSLHSHSTWQRQARVRRSPCTFVALGE